MKQFPKEFVFGAATAAYQVEGAVGEDGRGPSIWDVFAHTTGKTYRGQTGDVACDQYHRYRDDILLLRELGFASYRFSIAWPRIFPTGSGPVNEAGVDYYLRLTEALLEQGIVPLATLYHWDLPLALGERGGWVNRDTASYFAEYAAVVMERLGDRIPRWITLNEPSVVAYAGHLLGEHAPGHHDMGEALRAAHHLLVGHAEAVEAMRAQAAKVEVGVTLNLSPVYPVDADPDNIAAATIYDGQLNRFFLDAVCRGEYPQDILAVYGEFTDLSYIAQEDMNLLKRQNIDFLGVNYYFPNVVRKGAHPLLVEALPPDGPLTEMGWPIKPEGLHDLLLRIARDYPDIPLYITENGAAFTDTVQAGRVHDPARTDFLRRHLEACLDAIADGVDLRGYYVWSLLDNFEWAYGYSKRFGIVYVDYETQQRIPKDSALWLKQFMAAQTDRGVMSNERRTSRTGFHG